MTDTVLNTLDDYHTARAANEAQQDRFAVYSGNNPDKYASDIRSALARLHRVEDYLKRTGLLPVTEHEAITFRLDATYRNARSRRFVMLDDKRDRMSFNNVLVSTLGQLSAEARAWHGVK